MSDTIHDPSDRDDYHDMSDHERAAITPGWEPPRHRWSEVDVRNITFNPTFDTLPNVCREAEDHGFALVCLVPVHQYQAVAVFQRLGVCQRRRDA